MEKLFLFDVDGTLIKMRYTKLHRIHRFPKTIKNLYGLDVDLDWDHLGLTDKLILERLLLDQGWTPEKVEESIPDLVRELDRVHQEDFVEGSIELLPGVVELLEALKAHPQVKLGLITGNLESVAERKLGDVGIYHYFPLGGFGSDPHIRRADLVKVAMSKAGHANPDLVYVIGDTPRDIEASHQAGVKHSVGVANGLRDTKELRDAGAELVFEDFSDTAEVLGKFRLK